MEHYLGVIVNTVLVLTGSFIGLIIKKGISTKIIDTVMQTIALCVIAIAIIGILKSENQLVMILSMIFGVIIGTLLDLDGKITKFGDWLNKKVKKNDGLDNKVSITEGFVSASLLFCIGAMTIVGSINAGVLGDNQMLYAKSLMDGIAAIVLTASLGIGVMFSSLFILLFQGALVTLAIFLGSFLSDYMIAELVCTGSVMILAIGLNMLGITKIKVANLMPALIFVPLLCMVIK
ncbi:MAG: DUF554 domain-containing protein [Ruminococcaceae bacterium]|nr:DUF554 domain-containing protein [Oscillospiraceae bacterium]